MHGYRGLVALHRCPTARALGWTACQTGVSAPLAKVAALSRVLVVAEQPNCDTVSQGETFPTVAVRQDVALHRRLDGMCARVGPRHKTQQARNRTGVMLYLVAACRARSMALNHFERGREIFGQWRGLRCGFDEAQRQHVVTNDDTYDGVNRCQCRFWAGIDSCA